MKEYFIANSFDSTNSQYCVLGCGVVRLLLGLLAIAFVLVVFFRKDTFSSLNQVLSWSVGIIILLILCEMFC